MRLSLFSPTGITSVDVFLFRDDSEDSGDLLHQVATLLLWDVTILSINTHNKVGPGKNYLYTWPGHYFFVPWKILLYTVILNVAL